MKKKIIWVVISCLIVAATVLASCSPPATEEEEAAPPKEEVATEEEIATEEEVTAEEEAATTSKDNVIEFSPNGYDLLFAHGMLHEIEIAITQEEWDGLIQDMKNYARTDPSGKGLTGNYRKATFIYKGPADDAIIEEVGFRTKGHYTRPIPEDELGFFHRAHFRVRFNEVFDQEEGTEEYEARRDRRFARLRTLELRLNLQDIRWDNSQIRELYCYDLVNRAGVYTSKTGSATVTITIDGEKHYFGVYTLIETIDRSYLTKRYGNANNNGNLYKCLWGDSGPSTLERIDEKFTDNPIFPEERAIGVKDWETHYRPTYDLKTNEDAADHTELLNFIDNINTLSGADLKDYLDANFEVDRFLKYQAINMLIGRWDDYWAMGNNYYLYFNNDGKIEFMPNDYDMALGGGFMLFDTASVGIYEWGNSCRQFLQLVAPQIPTSWLDEYCDYHSPLVEKIFEIDDYKARYEHYLKEFITPANKLFVYSEYEKKFNMMYELYSPYLDNEMDEGEEMINDERTREYFRKRTKSIIEQLGLNEEDYELPPAMEPVVEKELSAYEYPEELPFEAKEITNAKYGFSLKHPSDWTDTTVTELYAAIAPSKLTGLFVSAWDVAWGSNLDEVLTLTLPEAPVEILASADTTLADGTPAAVVEYNATITGWPMHCLSLGVIKDGKWIVVNIWNIDQYATYDRALFEEIAHTLQFD